ncbi:non-ribosomal peptide synthetase [Nocardia jejuensis]|uniref:non-ribosomal peptide synthetase n=1 Tax=Nocardia jejuensis TaxID=328049 RepID=UPI000B16A5EC|nr:non-ribosomal peptide synthetase [Nocardia jejuensis]
MRDGTRLTDTRSPRPRRGSTTAGRTLPSLLAAAAAHSPDTIAVLTEGTTLSYRALDAHTNQWARKLCALGIGPEDRVAIALPRSVDSISATWAIAKTGAAFVPVDPTAPRARIDYQLTDSGCTYGLTHQRYLIDPPANIRWLAVDDPHLREQLALEPTSAISYLDRRAPLRISNIAYMIYTSGSTGKPKGVGVTHAGLESLCAHLRTSLAVTTNARALHCASLSFDASILELLMTIGSAATLVIAPPTIMGGAELAEFLHRHRITHAFLTPSVLATINPDGLDTLTTLVVGGEPCPPSLLTQWASTDRRFHNLYGPTETTIAATLSRPLHSDTAVTIGATIPGVGYRVLDVRLRPAAPGAIGELYLTGPALARGYPGQEQLTAERFVADPLGTAGERMYRTGDLVRRLDTGNLEYHGRTDHQVKIRGQRIELGEIEHALTHLPGVEAAVTVARATATGDTELVAFVRAQPHTQPHPTELTDALATQLPTFMLPNSVTVLDQFPLTPTGKIDRTALRALSTHRDPALARPAANVGEQAITDVFAHVLGHQNLGSDTDFFTAGGNSLLATQVAARLSDTWQLRIPTQLIFDHPTVATLTKAIRSQHFDAPRPRLQAGIRPERIPLSPNQLRFWLRNQFDTASAVDNIGFALHLTGIDEPSLHAALNDVLTRHEALRTRYPTDESGPYQQILDPASVTDLFATRDIDTHDISAHVHRILRAGFDVTTHVPLRVRLLRTPDEHILVCAMHHICADGSSLAPLATDLTLAYTSRRTGNTPTWTPISVQYADYALWQQNLLGDRHTAGSLLAQQLRYWQQELDGLPEQLDLPSDRPRPAIASLRGASLDGTVPSQVHRQLLEFARSRHASIFMVMRTALAILLARLSDTRDIAIGVPMTNRAEPALNGVVGMFVNTTVSRTRLDLAESFVSLLARTRIQDLTNFAHSDVPFEHVVDTIDPIRSPGRHPLYQVGFAFQNFTQAHLEIPDTATTMVEVDSDTVKTDLHIGVIDTRNTDGTPGPIAIRFGYSTDLFDQSTVQAFLDAYLHLLSSILTDPHTPVGDLALTDDNPPNRLHGADHPVPHEPLGAALIRQAAREPDAIAVTCGIDSITYAHLHARVTRLARWLITQKIGPESIVAVAMRRSIDQVVTLHAIAEAGAAWVPIDPDHPHQRIEHILQSAGAQMILTTTSDQFTTGNPHTIDTLDLAEFPSAPVHDRERTTPLHPDHPAYVIYTSGSTGRPKGVVVTHHAIVNQLTWMRTRYHVEPPDIYLHKTAATFDVSLWGYFLPLSSGARLVLATHDEHRDPHAIARLIDTHHITLTDFVPTMLTLLTRSAQPHQLCSLRAVFVIGEALPPDTARAFTTLCPAQLHNLYGPTEAAVSITEHHVQDTDLCTPTVPIGVPAWNSQCHIIDSRLHPTAARAAGELMLAGDQLARGYHRAPALTAARFVANPFGAPGTRIYRSGDLARVGSHATLDYLGRTDSQIKIRGHRIELAEIESVLLEDPAVAQAAAAVRRRNGNDCLLAYVVPRPGATADPKLLRRHLSDTLPSYMIPSNVTVIPELPVNTSGKLDRAALPEPPFTTTEDTVPTTVLERNIAQVFRDVLDVPRIGVTDDFFELGGSSLLIFLLHQRLAQQLGHDVPMRAILAAPSVRGVAAYLTGNQSPHPHSQPAIDAILEPSIIAPEPMPRANEPAHQVLLTGATGFLGTHLLHELLTTTNAHVWCLVRATDHESARHRIIESLKRFQLPTALVDQRVSALRADLGAPLLGLEPAQFAQLADQVDAIYHNGARVNHLDPYERLRQVNVQGTRSILQLATTLRIKPVHFISTLGAAIPANQVPRIVAEDDRLHAHQVQDNGYLTSKWVGEELIRQAGERGVPTTIFRPGTICGHTRTAVNNPDDAFWNMIRAAAILAAAPPMDDARVSLVPVDYVAQAIIAITTQPRQHSVYHLVNHTPVAVDEVLQCLREHGLPIAVTSLDALRRELEEQSNTRATSGDDSLTRAALLAPTFAALAAHTQYSDTYTRKMLHGKTIHCPAVDRELIHRYIAQFSREGYLSAP